MTLLDVPPSLPDSEIISGILNKNPQIKEFLNAGHTLTLVFSRVRDGKKMAVLKMSPDVRNVDARSGNRVFLGLTSLLDNLKVRITELEATARDEEGNLPASESGEV